jgi:serine/threonine-protein kinase
MPTKSSRALAPEKSLPVPLALSIASQIAEGLGAAHAKGMVHRDIKPENILMARDAAAWLPKIADFGIVATKESSTAYTRTGGTLLTMAYAAPEQWRGTPAASLDGRTDLYALGGLLYEMLTGRSVFHAENYEGWSRQHQTTPPQPPSTLRPIWPTGAASTPSPSASSPKTAKTAPKTLPNCSACSTQCCICHPKSVGKL